MMSSRVHVARRLGVAGSRFRPHRVCDGECGGEVTPRLCQHARGVTTSVLDNRGSSLHSCMKGSFVQSHSAVAA